MYRFWRYWHTWVILFLTVNVLKDFTYDDNLFMFYIVVLYTVHYNNLRYRAGALGGIPALKALTRNP